MKVTRCDCCGRQITKNIHMFSYLCHLDKEYRDHGRCHVTKIDGRFEPTSGRSIDKDLCLPCYNLIIGNAVKEFERLCELYEQRGSN